MKTNFHTHTLWCDGKSSTEEVVAAAIEKGFSAIGFSSHMAFPSQEPWELKLGDAGAYVSEIAALREKYASRIEIFCGGEADYIRGHTTPDRARYAAMGLDYLIGSLHTVVSSDGVSVSVDSSPEILFAGIRDGFGGSARKFIEAYFEQEREMLGFDFDVLGHPDLVCKFNSRHPYFDPRESWYVRELELTAEKIAASGKIVEINTGAISRGWLDEAYPMPVFRDMLRARGVRFILSSDSHEASTVDCAFDRYADAEHYVPYPRADMQKGRCG